MYHFRWKPSKEQAREFARKMQEIEEFCKQNDISKSLSGDSYYFSINGQDYRVSNHSIEASNAHAFDDYGNQIRELYHDVVRDPNVTYIHASKTRIIEIYNALKSGKELDGRGNEKKPKKKAEE